MEILVNAYPGLDWRGPNAQCKLVTRKVGLPLVSCGNALRDTFYCGRFRASSTCNKVPELQGALVLVGYFQATEQGMDDLAVSKELS